MKKLWNYYTDYFGLTIFHPQYFMNKYNQQAISKVKRFSIKKDIVDFGCGRMNYKKYLLETSKSYFGIDHPTESKNYLSDNKPDLLTYFEKTNLPKNKFLTAMMLEVLEYLESPSTPEAVLTEIHRVLKPGGKLILTSPFMYPIHDGSIDKNRFTPIKIKSLLTNSGFKNVKVTGQGNFFVFITTSTLVYLFKNINNLNYLLRFLLIPIGVILSVLLNSVTVIFEKIKSNEFPINIIATAEK